ncbi:MAG: hypothetical protein HY744_01230 [Deltaproteobacteria bacterium]|nr:hypothetical protein [Deltaproteobacteria bacterium]
MVAAEQIVGLTSGLYGFMLRVEELTEPGRRPTAEGLARLRERALALLAGFAAVRQHLGAQMDATVDQISGALRTMVAELDAEHPIRRRLQAEWRALGAHYETLLEHVRRLRLAVPRSATLGHLKPRNLGRNAFHVGMGVLGIALYEFVLSRTLTLAIGGTLLASFLALELVRRHSVRWNERLWGRIFAPISRPGEAHRTCTSTWYLGGLMIGVWFFPQRAIELGTLVLAFGDPVASLVGKRWGRTKIWADKSLAGTLAFIAVSFGLCTAFICWRLPALGLASALGTAAAVSLAGALAELVSTKLNDNLTIPLVAGLVATLAL